MPMRHVRIAVLCDKPEAVVSILAQALGVEFEEHDSSYWGCYYFSELPQRVIRVFTNEDPMYRVGQDPTEEFYFEARFPAHRTLVDIENDTSQSETVASILSSHYPSSQVVSCVTEN